MYAADARCGGVRQVGEAYVVVIRGLDVGHADAPEQLGDAGLVVLVVNAPYGLLEVLPVVGVFKGEKAVLAGGAVPARTTCLGRGQDGFALRAVVELYKVLLCGHPEFLQENLQGIHVFWKT